VIQHHEVTVQLCELFYQPFTPQRTLIQWFVCNTRKQLISLFKILSVPLLWPCSLGRAHSLAVRTMGS